MAKQVIINKCDECPHAQFDPGEPSQHWGEWVCLHGDITDEQDYGIVLLDRNVVAEVPKWCPLDDYK